MKGKQRQEKTQLPRGKERERERWKIFLIFWIKSYLTTGVSLELSMKKWHKRSWKKGRKSLCKVPNVRDCVN